MDMQTVLAIASVLACVVGVATFIAGMVARAQNDGKLIGKVEYICTKVDEMSTDMKSNEKLRVKADIENAHQQEQIMTLFNNRDELRTKVQTLEERLNAYERNKLDRHPQ